MATVYISALLLGCICGLRSMTAPAVVSWGTRPGWLNLTGSRLSFFAHPAALVIFTLCAIGELIADKLPNIPRRTMIGPLGFRIVVGAACGAALAISAHAAVVAAAVLGAVGGVIGAYAGYNYRRVSAGKIPPLVAALLEDVVAVGGGFLLVSRF
jgi:uncharacterized membrane protein